MAEYSLNTTAFLRIVTDHIHAFMARVYIVLFDSYYH